MSRPDFPFDAVLFDLDGTLLATDRFWIPAARVGARRACAELGLELELPSAEQWMSLVGLPLAEGFEMLFPELDPGHRALIMKRCVEEEHFALESGSAALLPGVVDVLTELAARGVPMGIASNCSQAYLDSAMEKVELRRFISEGRCLDSPGIRNKADMIEDLLLTFGIRSALMVGDRAGDRDAAHANGLPHVHLENGFAPRGEQVECEARIVDFLELIPRLEGRTRWLDGLLTDLGFGGGEGGSTTIGITGRSGSGKSLFGRDIVERLRARGRDAVLVSLDASLRQDQSTSDQNTIPSVDSVPDLPANLYRLEELIETVLEPHIAGEPVTHPLIGEPDAGHSLSIAPEAVLVLEGPYLLHPRLRSLLERVIFLEAPDELLLRRVAARECPLGNAAELEQVRQFYLPAQARFDEVYPPESLADRVVDASNPFG